MIRRIVKWAIKKLTTWYYKKTLFLTWSWSIDEHTDIHIISEESCLDKHRFGVREEKYVSSPLDGVNPKEIPTKPHTFKYRGYSTNQIIIDESKLN